MECQWAKELKGNGKFTVHCYRTEPNPVYRKVVWELANRRNSVSCKCLIKHRVNSFKVDKDWIAFNYFLSINHIQMKEQEGRKKTK